MTRSGGGHPEVDVVVLTALEFEYDGVRAHLTGFGAYTEDNGTRYETGTVRGGRCRVALAVTGPGNLAAATLATRAITLFRPKALVFAGVAGSLDPSVALGDVVVATRVHHRSLAHAVEQAAREVARDVAWVGLLPPDTTAIPAVHFKPVVSGDGHVHEHRDDAVAIDTESAGVAEAAHRNDFRRLIIIRAIGAEATGQQRAARHAAAFAIAVAEWIAGQTADELAAQAAAAVVSAMATNAFAAVRADVVRLFKNQETQLDADNALVAAADDDAAVREALAQTWRHRLAHLLKSDPDAAEALRGLVVELPEERRRWVQTVIARDNSTVYAVQHGQIIQHDAPPE